MPRMKKTRKATSYKQRAKDVIKAGRLKMEDIDLRPIWKRVKSGLEKAVEAVGKGAERVAEKTLTAAERAGVEYRLYEQNRRLQHLLAELGGRVYDLAKRNPQALSPTDPEVLEMIGKIREAEKKISALEIKSRSLKK